MNRSICDGRCLTVARYGCGSTAHATGLTRKQQFISSTIIGVKTMNLLFIGNSATYVNEIPQTLSRLAMELGYEFQTAQLTPGGYTLTQHADTLTDHGKAVINEIKKGYDAVILQDNSICIKITKQAHIRRINIIKSFCNICCS